MTSLDGRGEDGENHGEDFERVDGWMQRAAFQSWCRMAEKGKEMAKGFSADFDICFRCYVIDGEVRNSSQ